MPAKVIVFALLLAVPFWELPADYLNFRKLCSENSAPTILQKFGPQEAICLPSADEGTIRAAKAAKFPRIELPNGTKGALRVQEDAVVRRVTVAEQQSSYCLSDGTFSRLPGRIQKVEDVVLDAKTGAPVAKQSGFAWAGMWWQEGAQPLLGRGGRCVPDLLPLLSVVRRGST